MNMLPDGNPFASIKGDSAHSDVVVFNPIILIH